MFTSSTQREIGYFHVVVVQRRRRNAQQRVMYVQSCCFSNHGGSRVAVAFVAHPRLHENKRFVPKIHFVMRSCLQYGGSVEHEHDQLF